MTTRLRAAAAALCALAGACGGGGWASIDTTGGPSRLLASRSELQDLAERLESQGPAAGRDSALLLLQVRARLTDGDFRLDDRVALYVDGEPSLTDTFTVDAPRTIVLPGVGIVSLAGVLRSELEDRMRQEIARIVRQPVVRARALIRIEVVGAVRAAGFHYVPADGLVSSPITAAGGYTVEAVQEDMHIDRAGEPVLAGQALAIALQSGRSIDQAGLQSGDQIVVPKKQPVRVYEIVRTVSLLLTIPITIYTLTVIF